MCEGTRDVPSFDNPPLPPASVLSHVRDVHCHPTDSWPAVVGELHITICAMSTRPEDQPLVRELALSRPDKVLPCFGYHPWFTHWFTLKDTPPSKEEHYSALFLGSATPSADHPHMTAFSELLPHLPNPTPLKEILATLRGNLAAFPSAMLGEVGIDRSFRVARSYTEDPRVLSPFTVPIAHQLAVLNAQLEVAVELRRNISMHSVKAQQLTVDLLASSRKRWGAQWDALSVDLHSCGLSPQTWVQLEKAHPNVFLSLSTAINARSPNHIALIRACDPRRLLVESDYHTLSMCTPNTWEMICTVARERGWTIEETWDYSADGGDIAQWGTVKRLEDNWKRFEQGGHASPDGGRKKRKERERTNIFTEVEEK